MSGYTIPSNGLGQDNYGSYLTSNISVDATATAASMCVGPFWLRMTKLRPDQGEYDDGYRWMITIGQDTKDEDVTQVELPHILFKKSDLERIHCPSVSGFDLPSAWADLLTLEMNDADKSVVQRLFFGDTESKSDEEFQVRKYSAPEASFCELLLRCRAFKDHPALSDTQRLAIRRVLDWNLFRVLDDYCHALIVALRCRQPRRSTRHRGAKPKTYRG